MVVLSTFMAHGTTEGLHKTNFSLTDTWHWLQAAQCHLDLIPEKKVIRGLWFCYTNPLMRTQERSCCVSVIYGAAPYEVYLHCWSPKPSHWSWLVEDLLIWPPQPLSRSFLLEQLAVWPTWSLSPWTQPKSGCRWAYTVWYTVSGLYFRTCILETLTGIVIPNLISQSN